MTLQDVSGSYEYIRPDGKLQRVVYRANKKGFFPIITVIGNDFQGEGHGDIDESSGISQNQVSENNEAGSNIQETEEPQEAAEGLRKNLRSLRKH